MTITKMKKYYKISEKHLKFLISETIYHYVIAAYILDLDKNEEYKQGIQKLLSDYNVDSVSDLAQFLIDSDPIRYKKLF